MENKIDRWTFAADMNLDGVVTISDVGLWIGWLFFVPGDLAVVGLILYLPGLATFLEFSLADFGGLSSGIISGIGWLTALSIYLALAERGN